jgi:phage tail sheath protein FI
MEKNMPIQLSPGVAIVEKDFTNIVPTIASSACGFAGVYVWGPVMEPTTITTENNLVATFGKPKSETAQSFFTAANFLSYSSNLLNIRINTAGNKNAVSNGTAVKINNSNDYASTFETATNTQVFAAKYPGALGNSIAVVIADAATFTTWDYKSQFTSIPGTSYFAASKGSSANDEMHILVIDALGEWTGVPGSILEKFAFVSKASNAKSENGTNNYYKDVLNVRSNYVWWMSHPEDANWGTTLTTSTAYDSLTVDYSETLTGGVDDFAADEGDQMDAFVLLDNVDLYQIAYIAAGKASHVVAEFIINNVAEVRKDTIVFISPQDIASDDVIIGSGSTGSTKIIAYRNELPSTSFAVMDTGYKYQYDRYNDLYHYVPLNGDVAGLCARTDATNDPWFSPGGLNRGQIKNVVKLAYNPTQSDRDALYTNGVNPVVSFPGQGVVLYGDKTMLAKPSAFDRIGVRRLFIILEKSVAVAAKFQLFEFNDGFTRAQFKNMIEPFLRDIQGRRGINDFQVVCDTSNNTDQVISSNNFVADIYIKPNYSINYITLNFIAGRQSVSFNTLGA